MKLYVTLFGIIFYFSAFIYGQEEYSDLKKIRNNYYTPIKQISYKLKILYYDKQKSAVPLDSSFGKYSFFKSNSFLSLEGITMISDGKLNVVVSDHAKIISILNEINSSTPDANLDYLDSISKLQNVKLSTRFNDDLKILVFKMKNEALDSVVVSYNKTSYLLNSIFVFYNIPFNADYKFPPVIKIWYLDQRQSESPDLKKYDMTFVFRTQNDQIVLQPKYKNYKLRTNVKF